MVAITDSLQFLRLRLHPKPCDGSFVPPRYLLVLFYLCPEHAGRSSFAPHPTPPHTIYLLEPLSTPLWNLHIAAKITWFLGPRPVPWGGLWVPISMGGGESCFALQKRASVHLGGSKLPLCPPEQTNQGMVRCWRRLGRRSKSRAWGLWTKRNAGILFEWKTLGLEWNQWIPFFPGLEKGEGNWDELTNVLPG